MIQRFSRFDESKKLAKDYQIISIDEMPKSVREYGDYFYNEIIQYFDDWFFGGMITTKVDEITFNLDDVLSNVGTESFKDFPLEDICIDLHLKHIENDGFYDAGDDVVETGGYQLISDDMIDFETSSFSQNSYSNIVDKSYYVRFQFNIEIPKKLKSIDVSRFKQRVKSVIYHELAHAYDNVKNSKIATVRAHINDSKNLKLLALACPSVREFIHLVYFTSPEEVYANIIGSKGFETYEEFKKFWLYKDIQKLKNFKAEEFISKLKADLPKDAVWESHEFERVRKYKLPAQFPKLFADYHQFLLYKFEGMQFIRDDYDHDKYSKLGKLTMAQFADYWEEEFNTVGQHYEENIMKMINDK